MKTLPRSLVLTAFTAALLSACGGGGDESGSPTSFSVVPAAITLKAPTDGEPEPGSCGSTLGGEGSRVFVYGGVPPYRLDNTSPEVVILDRSRVEHKGDYFVVHFSGTGCINPGHVVVVDSLDNQVTLTLTTEAVPDEAEEEE
jgi:hypothetical protein